MLFNFEKVCYNYRICIFSYQEKIRFLCAIFELEWRNRDLFSEMAIALQAFLLKNITSKHAKESTHIHYSIKKFNQKIFDFLRAIIPILS